MNGAQLIVASRYLKSGSKKSLAKRKNYTKYIATRETVEIRPQQKYDLHGDATAAQKDLLQELLLDFPEAKRYHEYTDYKMHPSAENCSELINAVIERNADVIGNKKNLVGYMAMRPGAEKRGAHGLFTDSDAPIVLNQVADEIAQHEGNVWSHVVSLRREDAVRLGYDNSESWRQLVKRHISDIAAAQKISLCNLKWYAAFHNTTHHPHIHLLVYSTDSKEGFLTTDGIERIKSVLANDIFKDELQSIYQAQTVSRDALRKMSAEEFETIIRQIHFADLDDSDLKMLVKKLYIQLQSAKGKKVYGYLPKDIKQTVDAIFKMLAKNEQIAALYEKWCDLEKLKYKTYSIREPDLPPMHQNKVFQPVRNQIIRTVLEFGTTIMPKAEQQDAIEKRVLADMVTELFLRLVAFIEDRYSQENRRMQVDSKLRRLIRKKKMELGMKEEPTHSQSI